MTRSPNLVPRRLPLATALATALSLLAACGGDKPPGPRPPVIEGVPTSATLSTEQQAEVDRLTALQAETAGLTPDQLLSRRAVPFQAQLGYDPQAAKNLNLVQASALKLDASELHSG